MMFRSVGQGKKISINVCILKMSTSASLLVLAPIIADFMMLQFFKDKKKFRARKFNHTQDFSDFFDNVQDKLDSLQDDEGEDLEDQLYEQEDEEWKRNMEEDE